MRWKTHMKHNEAGYYPILFDAILFYSLASDSKHPKFHHAGKVADSNVGSLPITKNQMSKDAMPNSKLPPCR